LLKVKFECAELPPEMNEQSGILSGEQARALAGALPARFRLCGWHLLYSTARHGISLQTLYRRWVPPPPGDRTLGTGRWDLDSSCGMQAASQAMFTFRVKSPRRLQFCRNFRVQQLTA